jgi:hypothetical protein
VVRNVGVRNMAGENVFIGQTGKYGMFPGSVFNANGSYFGAIQQLEH